MDNRLEIELRAKISKEIAKKLLADNITLSKSYQHDIYYKFISEPENSWIVRIREEENNYFLTYKSKNQPNEGAWSEVEIKIEKDSAKSLHDFYLQNGYKIEVEINKKRISFCDNELTINIDEIKNLGMFIEVEIFALESEIESAHKKIRNYLNLIGVSNENIIKKGYVALMKKEINNA